MNRRASHGAKQERIEVESAGWIPRGRLPLACRLSRMGTTVTLTAGRDQVEVRAIGPLGGRLIDLVAHTAATVDVVAVSSPQFTLRFQTFRERRVWPASIVRVPSAVVAELRPHERGDVDRWLQAEFAVAAEPASFAAHAGPLPLEPDRGFDLIGRRWRLTLQYEGAQRYFAKSLRRLHRRRDANGGATLLVGELRAEPAWLETGEEPDDDVDGGAVGQPSTLGGIAELWSAYSAELTRTIEAATDLDPLHFHRSWFDARKKVYVFEVDGQVPAGWRSGAEVAVPSTGASESPTSDESSIEPAEQDEADSEAVPTEKGAPKRRAVFAGTLESLSATEARVRPARNYASPPQMGELVVDRTGDKKQAKRQREALKRVQEHRAARPDLLEILEGRPDPSSLPRSSSAKKAATRRVLRGRELTEMQQLAVATAIATPDIAVIQGPPGTGKTTVLRAIVQGLYSLGERRILICAQGHDPLLRATDDLQAAGIPVLAFGGRNDEDRAQRVRPLQAVVDEVSATVEQHIPQDRLSLRETAAELIAIRAARPAEDDARAIARWLRRMVDVAEPHLPSEVAASARRIVLELREFTVDPQRPEWESLLAGLPSSEAAFADGGPRQARRLLQFAPPFAPADLDVVRKAARQMLGEPPPDGWEEFVSRLRSDHLQQAPALAALVASAAVACDLILGAVAGASRSGREGIAAALQDFLDEFRRRPDLVRDLLRHVAPAKGSTVGQVFQFDGDSLEEFDTVIVDEAARANPLELFLVLCRARRIILLGDEKQLPHMIDDAIAALVVEGLDADEARSQVLDRLRETLFGRLVRLYSECPPGGIRRVVALDVQFRSHPQIAGFVSDEFYGGGLRTPPGHEVVDPFRLLEEARIGWVDVRGGFERLRPDGSKFRTVEIDQVRALVGKALTRGEGSIGVISFYRAQVDRLKEAALTDGWGDRVQVGSVDAFQGREFDLVIVSCVRSNRSRRVGFLAMRNRICVAMSRAKGSLVCIGDARTTDKVPALRRFRHLCVEEGFHGQR